MNTHRLAVCRFVSRFLPESRFFGLKRALLRWAGAKVGRNVRLYSSARIVGTGTLEIGDDVHIGSNVFVSSVAPAGVALGSHVDIGPGAMILTGSHEIDWLGDHVAGKGTAAAVSVGSGSWIGARATILPGLSLAPKTAASRTKLGFQN